MRPGPSSSPNDKKRARLEAMRYVLSTLDYPDKDLAIARAPDPLIIGHASQVIHGSEHILGRACTRITAAARKRCDRGRKRRRDSPAPFSCAGGRALPGQCFAVAVARVAR